MLLPVLIYRPLLDYSTRTEWGIKKELHQPTPVPAKLPQDSAQFLRVHLQKGRRASWASSVANTTGCPHVHRHYEPPAPTLLGVGPTHFLGRLYVYKGCCRISCGNRNLFSCLGGFPAVTLEEQWLEVCTSGLLSDKDRFEVNPLNTEGKKCNQKKNVQKWLPNCLQVLRRRRKSKKRKLWCALPADTGTSLCCC